MFNNLITQEQAYNILHTLLITTDVLFFITVSILFTFTIKFIILFSRHIFKS